MLKLSIYPVGPIQTNCYVIYDETKKCMIIDPGEEGPKLIKLIEDAGLEPLAILLTHGHFDHLGAVDPVRDAFDIPVYIHEIEKDTLFDPVSNGSVRYPGLAPVKNREADHLISEEGMMQIGPFKFEIRHTPGHSPGSISFIFEEEGFAVVGDTLFSGGIGRTDLPGGDTDTLLNAIKDKLLSLASDTVIFPGHGQSTTPQHAMDTNPFLNGL